MADIFRIWQPDGTIVRQATITSNEAEAGNDVAEGRITEDEYEIGERDDD